MDGKQVAAPFGRQVAGRGLKEAEWAVVVGATGVLFRIDDRADPEFWTMFRVSRQEMCDMLIAMGFEALLPTTYTEG